MEEGLDFPHLHTTVAVLIDRVEDSAVAILDLCQRQCSVAVGIDNRKHHTHARDMHPPGPHAAWTHSIAAVIPSAISSGMVAPTVAAASLCPIPSTLRSRPLAHHFLHHLPHHFAHRIGVCVRLGAWCG